MAATGRVHTQAPRSWLATGPSVCGHVLPIRHNSLMMTPRNVSVAAKKRLMPRDYAFGEVYNVVTEKLRTRNQLSVRDTAQLIECIRTPEHAARCLDLIQAFLNTQSMMVAVDSMDGMEMPQQPPVPTVAPTGKDLGPFLKDWPTRKRFLARIAEIAVMELKRPEIAFAIIANTARLRLSPYFGKDLIEQLGQYSQVPVDVLSQLASLVRQQRGPADKGTKAAFRAVVAVMEDRGMSEEAIVALRQVLSPPPPTAAPPATATQPSPAQANTVLA